MKNNIQEIGLAEWARRQGVSRQLASRWYKTGRLAARKMGSAVVIKENHPQPIKFKPYGMTAFSEMAADILSA